PSRAGENRAPEPPAPPATITATSLADTSIRAFRAWSTVSFWPRLIARRRAGWPAATREATVTSSRPRLARGASAVSILVRLAGGTGVRLLRPHSTAPDAGSTRIAYLARTPRSHPGPGPGPTGPGAAAAPTGARVVARRPATRNSRRGQEGRGWPVRMGGRSVAPGDEPDKDAGPVLSRRHPLESSGATSITPSNQEPASMRVTVIGAGHVGLVTAACLAHVGHDVVVDDDDAGKLDLIRQGRSWFHEPGLEELLGEVVRAGRLRVAGDKAEAVGRGTVIFICVGTPSRGDGSPNLAFVEAGAREVAPSLPPGEFRLICEKSTVPVQTGERVAQVIAREARPEADWEVASNPEFLREGSAVVDPLHPDRVVVGTSSERGLIALRELYDPILERSGAPFLATDRATAELIKHASNAFLATKISFINSVARGWERSGADIELVARGMGLDPRIGVHFLKAGAGYGGSC